jgi:hypothetical protein
VSQIRKLLFLIASRGRSRLVRPAPEGGRFVTVWRSDHQTTAGELARQARQFLAQDHMEGLVVVAPRDELEAVRAKLDDLLVIVGGLAADLYDHEDADLARLDKALHAPWPER